ncbi:MAG: DivIVA domain-containing protein [Actinomycetota bacterium]
MDDLSPLFHDIEFKERFRGYDVEEVDAYIDRVAKAAALVQGRIAELQNRVAAAESQPRTVTAVSAPAAEPSSLDEESLTKMLLLAQRTADTAIEEAHVEAAEIRRQADEHASLVLAEAETDKRRMQAEAEASVEAAIRTERERVVAEVAELERYRAFLTDDIAILESHLESSRTALQASVAALQELVDAPEQFRAPAMPETSGAQPPAALVADEPVVDHTPVPETDPAPVFEPWSEVVETPDPAPDADLDDGVVTPEPALAEVVGEVIADAEPTVDADSEPLIETEPMITEPAPVFESGVMFDAAPVEAPAAEPVAEVVPEPEPVHEIDPVVAFDAEPAPVFEMEPQGTEVLWAEDAAAADALTFDPGPMPDHPPAPLPAADGAPVVDLTDEPIVLDGPPTAPTPVVDTGFVVDQPVTGEWSDSDTGTHTAIAPPLLVTAADLDEAPAVETDWIDDLRFEAEPVAQPTTSDDDLLFDDPEPSSSSEVFLEQLRDAVSGETGEEFGEDALAAFFDDGEDDGGRTWFNRRR